MTTRNWNDQKMEMIIGTLLRTGVLLAAAVVLTGAVIYLSQHGHQIANYYSFHGEPAALESVGAILHGVVTWKGRSIIQLGLLVLIATPVARVAFAVLGFAIEHDSMYVVITLIVLGILLYSLLWSR